MAYNNLLITRDSKAHEHCRKVIKSKEYDNDMYKLMYYTCRSAGDNHNEAKKIANNATENLKYKNVVHIRDVDNILKNYVRLEE